MLPTPVAIGGILLALLISGGIAIAGAHGGVDFLGLPLMICCAILAFVVQWVVFIHSWLTRSERLYDLTGSFTFIIMVIAALVIAGRYDLRSVLIAAAIVIWALRLGPFLFNRIAKAGEDRRFRTIKTSFPTFLMTWTMQGNWVFVTASAGVAAITSGIVAPAEWTLWAGLAIWAFGFAVEVISDNQKSRFNADPANEGQFIRSGLWSWSRHPNYFGEIVLWAGVAVMAFPALIGNQVFTLIAPIFVMLQLTLISGVRMLEHRANREWGEDPEYQAYKNATPTLMLWPPRSPS